MARQTQKFIKAIAIVGNHFSNSSHESLYQLMNEQQYFWDSHLKEWILLPAELNDPATRLHRVRVWATTNQVETLARAIIENLTAQGYELEERSTIYPCRPPKGNESRIYLSFHPPSESITITVERSIPQPDNGNMIEGNEAAKFPRPGDMVMGDQL